ncbi:MAG: aminoglycoside phosphotransferase family protein [Clostridia bacterium]|nr:aminoglycoside phosphotransferase family protein [Clostridia bacterium]
MFDLTKDKNNIKELFAKLNLNKIEKITRIHSSQNLVYKVDTKNEKYVVKKFSKDAIKNDYELKKKKRQIKVSKLLNQKGINTILPIGFENKEFIFYKGEYYLIYNFCNYQTIYREKIKLKHIEIMATTLAKIHKLKIKVDLPCHYKKIDIDLEKYIKLYKKVDLKVYEILKEKQKELENLIANCNENIKYVKQNMCISHNDYKLLNMLWNKDDLYLIDFDAAGIVNPTTAMVEAAFSLSRVGEEINEKYLITFIRKYTEILKVNYNEYILALDVAMNGKLKWFRYILDEGLKNKKYSEDVYKMVINFSTYTKYKEMLRVLGKDIKIW